MVEAFQEVAAKLPNARLVIAGGNHPQAAGYVESIKQKWAHDSRIEFTGYLDEDRLPDIFQSSSVAVMPYSSSTGCSGVAHLACAYGVPIVCADLPDFRQMAEGEDIAIEFYQPGQAQDLARCLIGFLTNPAQQEAMATQNFASALRMTMPTIVQKYLRHFELHQKAEALRHVIRFRRLPNWLPSKARLLRIMTRNSLGWVHRSPALYRSSRNGIERKSLLDNQVDGSGGLAGARRPLNGDGEMRHFIAGGNSAGFGYSSAGNGNHPESNDGSEGEQPQPAPVWPASYKSESCYADPNQPGPIKRDPLSPLG
jgi:hypothetical protein